VAWTDPSLTNIPIKAEHIIELRNKYDTLNIIPISTKTTNYTLTLNDSGSLIEMNSSSTLTVTIPTNTSVSFPIGTQILIVQMGIGQVNISGTGVTIKKSNGYNARTAGQNSMVGLIKSATDTWYLLGDLEKA